MTTNEKINEFIGYFIPWGSRDVDRAVEIIEEYGLDQREIQEQIEEFCESCETKISDIDVVYQVYEHILQMSRNKISEVLKYDFLNDAKYGEIYTYGNYMCTSYDYKEEAKEELQNILNKATKEQKELMNECVYFKAFISLMELEVEE